ncbi:TPR-like protein [Plenodomus tracheiphilus IPT5]|uniref:TPR-like protein n=1 Tax=Plenodomus tracheiphilus IPT5 TaxID=1408161 RepID=A0A6A7B1E6_9PLEO|nr:TPR-like protein [Plenodomus tracheiphilus IPT5]
MNKFARASEEDFETVADVVRDMAEGSPALLLARSQYYGKHKIEFSLQGVPLVSQFVGRPAEMTAIEQLLLETSPATSPATRRQRKVVVVHGLGGIGKTQLVVKFARTHHHRFSAVFWLDGSSVASLKQSFVKMLQRLPRDELTADGVAQLSDAAVKADVAVRECQWWLSIPSNRHWLLIIDNVDRDHYDKGDPQAYDVKTYFPHTDYGSVLITSRLASLQRLGPGVKVGTLAAEQARAILETNAGRVVKDAEVVIELLHGLPLALTQAGSYIRETNASASTYAKHYSQTWERLMKSEARFPPEEYGDQSVLTTWTISYEQVQRQSEGAAWLLKLWGFLDSGEVWYELIAAGSDLAAEIDVPAWLLAVAEDNLAYSEAIGLLSRYSLAEGGEGTDSHSMHSVLHRWCRYLAEDEEQQELGCLAAGLVALSVPAKSDVEFLKKRKQVVAHGLCVSRWIEVNAGSDKGRVVKALVKPSYFHNLGYLLADEDRQRAVQMYQRALQGYEKAWGPEHTSTLDTVNNLGILYKNLGQLDEAEKMYQRALQGKEKAWGPEHTSTLDTVNNLGLLYTDLGQLDEAEKMYQRALQGKEKAWGPEHTSTLNTVNNLGNLYADLGWLNKAEKMYQRALQGKEKAWGPEHTSTLDTVNNLGLLYTDLGQLDEAEKMYQRALQGKEKAWGPEHTSTLITVYNWGLLYAKLGRLEEAEKMYQRALHGYANAFTPDKIMTFVPALDNVWAFASLRQSQGRIEDARHWYSHALLGYERTFGERSDKCQALRDNLAALASEEEEEELDASTNIASVQSHAPTYSEVDVRLPPTRPASR